MIKKILSFILILSFAVMPVETMALSENDLNVCISDTLQKLNSLSNNDGMYGLQGAECTSSGDWLAIALMRTNSNFNYTKFSSVMQSTRASQYSSGTWNPVPTEYHRYILALNAFGIDPTTAGKPICGEDNLLSTAVFNNNKLGFQGVIGWIWGLIALDSGNYSVPSDSVYTRSKIIKNILQYQLADGENKTLGGWSNSGKYSDVDVTSMAIIALSRYYNYDDEYTYSLRNSTITVTSTVHSVLNSALKKLDSLKNANGTYSSYSTPNCESTAQAICAKVSCGRDATDEYNGLLTFRTNNLFSHTAGAKYDLMATSQALLALNAIKLSKENKSLYDFFEYSSYYMANVDAAQTLVDSATTTELMGKALSSVNSLGEYSRFVVNTDNIFNTLLPQKVVCTHSNNGWTIKKKSNYFSTGLKYHVCTFCGKIYDKTIISKKVLSAPKLNVNKKSSSVNVILSKVKDATSYRVYYKINNGKWRVLKTTKQRIIKIKRNSKLKNYSFKAVARRTVSGKTVVGKVSKTKSIRA